MKDTIYRADAMGAVQDHFNADGFKGYDDGQKMMDRIKALPSAETKGDLISRQDAVNTIKRYKHRLQGRGQTYGFLLEEFEHQIPSASAEAVQGEWGHMIADGSDGSHWYEYECSHCGEVVLRPYNFCPNCGARMKGGGSE